MLEQISEFLPQIQDIGRALAACILAFPIGLHRESHEKNAGLRTYPLVAVTCCIFVLVGKSLVPSEGIEHDAAARLIAGVMTGLGFLGGGAILKNNESVKGTATAITLWGTGAIGVACAFNRFDLAILLSALMYVSLVLLAPLKKKVKNHQSER
ncbi:putative Mg2+ transporter-C (MgtC) family protein [Rubritalea squalenifaciens DSM 18772]|uniref:Putative Mg2+ transporter-C (MgtC) family protein n=1 Tax=Rubritalea squalenifaciens DSM 18772 TaxID=1123071 RepID=A0A1M6NLU8_9BACT|nr:MgtC/SapB family protein [Rubritalea squalenifaciens]SHJ96606.1 putative Mg2+ transporter-C (MgtC) family protein [Rubritalea squalenifaciens DSM 18772]